MFINFKVKGTLAYKINRYR